MEGKEDQGWWLLGGSKEWSRCRDRWGPLEGKLEKEKKKWKKGEERKNEVKEKMEEKSPEREK